MRFLPAFWLGLIESGAWLRNAEHANACAARFAARLERDALKRSRFRFRFGGKSDSPFLLLEAGSRNGAGFFPRSSRTGCIGG
jgi:hypothetical protein